MIIFQYILCDQSLYNWYSINPCTVDWQSINIQSIGSPSIYNRCNLRILRNIWRQINAFHSPLSRRVVLAVRIRQSHQGNCVWLWVVTFVSGVCSNTVIWCRYQRWKKRGRFSVCLGGFIVLVTYDRYQSQTRQVGRLYYIIDYKEDSLGSRSSFPNQLGALTIGKLLVCPPPFNGITNLAGSGRDPICPRNKN